MESYGVIVTGKGKAYLLHCGRTRGPGGTITPYFDLTKSHVGVSLPRKESFLVIANRHRKMRSLSVVSGSETGEALH